jgi:HEAT repeat protein
MKPPRRTHTWFVSMLLTATAAVVFVSAYLVLWPVWQEHQTARALGAALRAGDDQRCDALLRANRGLRRPYAIVRTLIEALDDNRHEVRQKAAWYLGEIGPEARPAVPRLVMALGDREWNVRNVSAVALESMGAVAVSGLIDGLSAPNPDVRGWSAEALGKIGAPAGTSIARLQEVVRDPSELPDVRADVAIALAKLNAIGPVAPIIDILRNGDNRVQWKVASSLEKSCPQAIPALLEALASDDKTLRSGAAFALATLAKQSGAETAIPALIGSLGDADALVRRWAAMGLGAFGAAAKSEAVMERLLKALEDPDPWVKYYAAWTIANVYGETDQAVEVLDKLLDAPNRDVRESVVFWATSMGAKGLPLLIRSIENEDRNCRILAIAYLSQIGSAAEPALPALRKAAEQLDRETSIEATRAVGAIQAATTATGP